MIAAPEAEPRASSCSAGSESSSCSEAEDEGVPVQGLEASGWLSAELPNGCPLPSPEPPSFAEVNVSHSSNVHLGNRTFYKGPLTIKQFVYSNSALPPPPTTTQLETDHGKDQQGSTQPLYPPAKPAAWFQSKRYLVGVCAAALIIASVTALTVYLSNSSGTQYPPKRPIVPAVPNDSSINNVTGVQFVPRWEWRANLPREGREPLSTLPPPFAIIIHTVTPFCRTKPRCIDSVRNIQEHHMRSLEYNDIGYNFLIGGDGSVFVGLGWDVEGAHTLGWNKNSLGIAFIGDYKFDSPTEAQLDACKGLLELSVRENKLSRSYRLLGHRQVAATESPGDKLFEAIKKFEHWAPN